MSQIPDDLKQRYEKLASYKPMELAVTEIYVRDWLVLIERIGRVEAENKLLSIEAQTKSAFGICLEAENAALKAQVDRLKAPATDMEQETAMAFAHGFDMVIAKRLAPQQKR